MGSIRPESARALHQPLGDTITAISSDNSLRPVPLGPVAWIGFLAMCLGMFMAVLDIQIVASSLPDIQTAFGIPLDLLSWVQTAYLIAEIIAIPLTARLTRLLSLRGLFVVAISGLHLGQPRGGAEPELRPASSLPRDPGLLRRRHHSRGLHRGLRPLSPGSPRAADHDRRHLRHGGADAGARGRRLYHRHLFLALDVPDQSAAGPAGRGFDGRAAAGRRAPIGLSCASSTMPARRWPRSSWDRSCSSSRRRRSIIGPAAISPCLRLSAWPAGSARCTAA